MAADMLLPALQEAVAVSIGVSFLAGKRKEKSPKERLEMAASKMELALGRSAKLLVTDDVTLLLRWKTLKCAYVNALELLDRHISAPAAGLKTDDVRRFEVLASCAGKFVRDVEFEYSLRRHLCPAWLRTSLRRHSSIWLRAGWSCLAEAATPDVQFQLPAACVDLLSRSYGVIVMQMKRMYLTVHDICTASFVNYCIPTDGIQELQERCSKYSQQAIGFAIPTFSGYVVSESSSTRDTATIKGAVVAAFFVAITADLVSWRMKPVAWGRVVLVYISCFHLLLMTFLVSISFDEAYGYAALFAPLIVATVVVLQRKLRSGGGVRRRGTDDEAVGQDRLDFMFDLSALIVNWDSVITFIGGQFPSAGTNKCIAASAAGFLFFSTIVLSLFLLMVTTVRAKALTVHVKHLDVLLIVLLVSTLIATATVFLYFSDQEMEWQVPT